MTLLAALSGSALIVALAGLVYALHLLSKAVQRGDETRRVADNERVRGDRAEHSLQEWQASHAKVSSLLTAKGAELDGERAARQVLEKEREALMGRLVKENPGMSLGALNDELRALSEMSFASSAVTAVDRDRNGAVHESITDHNLTPVERPGRGRK